MFKQLLLKCVLSGMLLGSVLLAVISGINPLFADSRVLVLAAFVFLPAAAVSSCYLILFYLLRWILRRTTRSRLRLVTDGLLFASFPGMSLLLYTFLKHNEVISGGLFLVIMTGSLAAGLLFSFLIQERVLRKIGRGPCCSVALIVIVCLLAFSGLYRHVKLKPPRAALVVLGLDGASWDVIDPLRAEGKLPVMDSLLKNGTSGVLKSIQPMFSPRIWASISTGKVPQKHGVMDFYGATLKELRAPTIWEILLQKGWKVGVFEWLVSWPPPDEMNGFWIPGWLARSTECYPGELGFLKEIKFRKKGGAPLGPLEVMQLTFRGIRYGFRLGTLYDSLVTLADKMVHGQSFLDYYWPLYRVSLSMDRDVASYLLYRDRPDAAFIYFQTIDSISHNYWKFFEPENFSDVTDEEIARYEDIVPTSYMYADRVMGEILDIFEGEPNVFLVSDHGFQPYITDTGGGEKQWFSFNSKYMIELLDFPCKIRALASRGIFLRPECDDVDQPGRERSLEKLHSALLEFRLADTMEPLFDPTFDKEQSEGDFIRLDVNENLKEKLKHQDIKQLSARIHVRHKGRTYLFKEFLTFFNPISGAHQEDGIFMATGKNFRKAHRLTGASVLDVTPTILASIDIPVGEDMDGRVLSGLFVHPRTPSTVPTYPLPDRGFGTKMTAGEFGEEDLSSRLKVLGYIQ